MIPTAVNPNPTFPVTEQNPQSTGVNTTTVTPTFNNNDQSRISSVTISERQVEPRSKALNTTQVRQFTRYEKSSVPHINCPDSPLTDALLCIKQPEGMQGNDEPGFAGVSMFTNTGFLKLLFEIVKLHQGVTESCETIQINDAQQPLKLINITAPASLKVTNIAEAIYLCNLHLLAGSLTDTKLQDEITHYDLDKCLQIMIAIDYLTSSVNNPHTRFVTDKILEKIEQDWVKTISHCTDEEETEWVLINPEGQKLIRLFAASSNDKRQGYRLSDTETNEGDPQKPAEMNRERLIELVEKIKDTLSLYPDLLEPVKRMQRLLVQLFHLLDHKDIIQFLSRKSELTISCPHAIEFHPTCPQWLLNAREFGDGILKDLGYYIIPPFGTYEPIYEYDETHSNYYKLPEPFASVAAAFDIYDIYQEKESDTLIEVRAYTHPTKAGYSVMCLTMNKS